MTFGMGYFIWYVWQYVTKKLKPTISASHKMLINLLHQIRMLDNDLIILSTNTNPSTDIGDNNYKLVEDYLKLSINSTQTPRRIPQGFYPQPTES